MRIRSNVALGRGAAFLAGVGFAAVPAAGPFVALVAWLNQRLELQRADRLWWLAAVLLSVPLLLTGHPVAAAETLAQVLAAWLLFRSATALRERLAPHSLSGFIGAGLVVGLVIAFLVGLRQLDGFRWATARTPLDAITWQTHPATFGHMMLVLSALFAVVVPSPRLRAVALAVGAAGVVLSGAREAMLAWLLVAVLLRFVGRRGTGATRAAEWTLVGMMFLLASGVLAPVGVGRTGFLTAFQPASVEANVFRGTEVAEGDWWFPLGVTYTASTLEVEGVLRSAIIVTKRSEDPWSRLQQVVTLEPGQTYTLSAVLRPMGDTRPGFDGWGMQAGDETATNLGTTLVDGGHEARTTGGVTLLSTSAVDLGNGQVRAQVTFRYEGERPLTWYVGVVPDRSNLTNVSTAFAELQLTATDAPLPYVPGRAERGVASLRASRFPVWRDAVDAIAARPLVGWGPGGLPVAVEALQAEQARLRPIASHAHNMALAVWVERGVIGLVGLVALLVALSLRAVQHRDKAAAVVLLGVLLLNSLDATLLAGAVLYPLAAVLGWRAVGRRPLASCETGRLSAAANRVGLALVDLASAGAAYGVAAWVLSRLGSTAPQATDVGTLLYCLAAWPVAGMWLGMYPGYGRAHWQELRDSLRTALAAGAAILAIRSAFGDAVAVPWQMTALATGFAAFLLPAGRSLAKQALLAARLWGRPAVLVGSCGSADRLAKGLLDQPELGIRPVALVDGERTAPGDPSLAALTVDEVPYSSDGPTHHVVVVPGPHPSPTVLGVIAAAGRRAFKVVQVVPELGPVPTSDVVARPIGRSLSLEIRNNLASTWNRAVKRSFDLVAVVLGGVFAVPMILAIAAAIRLTSPGPVFYTQPRLGRDGREFRIWKFRSMVVDAEERLAKLLAEDPAARREWEATQKLTNDPRVTKVGRFLRATSLDELPQLLNVLRGQMSLVGPRPIVAAEVEKYGEAYGLYTQVRPGMTGYWQVSGRSDTSYEYRVELDTYYVRNWSVWLDLDLILRTFAAVLRRDGAY